MGVGGPAALSVLEVTSHHTPPRSDFDVQLEDDGRDHGKITVKQREALRRLGKVQLSAAKNARSRSMYAAYLHFLPVFNPLTRLLFRNSVRIKLALAPLLHPTHPFDTFERV